ncbi:ROK family protein [Prolixibacteraceae bacterium Z1-6]|uniref:ROK family protein n=1 Tax=Draconibacterium aestuarii TaxID=2998507 RepID=A0A9X3F2Y2_9BACT|nr:ROK family protein [Prolixibacteraceae bacterium Z1-6]
MSEIIIGVDLGGTRIKAVAIDETGNILFENYQPTDDGDDKIWKNAVKRAVQTIQNKIENAGTVIGISAPGLPNEKNSAIGFMPGRLQGLENFIWSDFLGTKAFVLNDAVAAMMAEAKFGAAKNKKNVIMLTLGTGVGGGILIDGKPYQGAFQKAGHLGHLSLDSNAEPDIIGVPGSLEDAIGNCTIEKRTGGRFTSTDELIKAHRKGDEFATQVWMTSVNKLAVALASFTNILSPETIILGGGITEAGNDLFKPLEKLMAKYEWRSGGNQTEVVKAQYGDLAGAVGAACFAKQF